MKRQQQICPECGIIIYMNHHFFYQCPVHGQYDLNYNTGLLVKMVEPRKRGAECQLEKKENKQEN